MYTRTDHSNATPLGAKSRKIVNLKNQVCQFSLPVQVEQCLTTATHTRRVSTPRGVLVCVALKGFALEKHPVFFPFATAPRQDKTVRDISIQIVFS